MGCPLGSLFFLHSCCFVVIVFLQCVYVVRRGIAHLKYIV